MRGLRGAVRPCFHPLCNRSSPCHPLFSALNLWSFHSLPLFHHASGIGVSFCLSLAVFSLLFAFNFCLFVSSETPESSDPTIYQAFLFFLLPVSGQLLFSHYHRILYLRHFVLVFQLVFPLRVWVCVIRELLDTVQPSCVYVFSHSQRVGSVQSHLVRISVNWVFPLIMPPPWPLCKS